MPDLFDQSQEGAEREVEAARRIQAAQAAKYEAPAPTGECLNPLCGEPVESPKLYCDRKCADAHARRSK